MMTWQKDAFSGDAWRCWVSLLHLLQTFLSALVKCTRQKSLSNLQLKLATTSKKTGSATFGAMICDSLLMTHAGNLPTICMQQIAWDYRQEAFLFSTKLSVCRPLLFHIKTLLYSEEWSIHTAHCKFWQSSSSRMRVVNHNWSAMKQCLHLQSVAEISRHSVLSGDRIRQCGTSSGSRHKDADQCL